MTDKTKQEILDELHEAGKSFREAANAYQQMANSYFSGLSPEEQLWAFCAVVEKLCKGELDEGRSYRGVLYGTFGWGPEAYAVAQHAGFLALHNSIYRFEDMKFVLESTLKDLELEVDPEKLSDALARNFF